MARRSEGLLSRTATVVLVVIVLLVAAGVGAKVIADNAAVDQVEARAAEVTDLIEGATPADFLAFNSGRSVPDSVAKQVSDAPDFVSVDARGERAVIRFQPEGWWEGFTERCVVAIVRDSGVTVLTPKTACVRVDPDDF